MRALIPALLLLPLPALAGGTAGLAPGAWAWQGSARHAVLPTLGLWATHSARPWSLTVELAGSHRNRGARTYRYRTSHLRASTVASLALGTHATTFHAGLGPALSVQTGSLRYGGERLPVGSIQAGVRVRMALDGPVAGRLGWSWHVATTSRGWSGVDYDTSVGLGVAW